MANNTKSSPLPSLDDQEESVRIAVRALGDMRNASIRAESSGQQLQSLSIPSTSSSQQYQSPSPASPKRRDSSQQRQQQQDPSPNSPAFVTRMSSLPLVGSALRVYEHGKASSRVVKYGAEMVESSVKTLSRPVIDRLPVNVNQLDEFACRQLDRLDRYRSGEVSSPSSSTPVTTPSTESASTPTTSERGRTKSRALNGSAAEGNEDMSMERSQSRPTTSRTQEVRLKKGWKEGGERGVPSWVESSSTYSSCRSDLDRSSTPTQTSSRSTTRPPPPGNDCTTSPSTDTPSANEQQVAQRSRWQAVLLEAGGLSAALSEDSMRRLKYCLQWLQYATAHIDAQILILREFTASLQTYPPSAPSHARRPNPISEDHLRKLAEVRKDVVQTVKQVVDVVSKYAGSALPEPARSRVRGFILKLPSKWATKAGVANGGMNPLVGAGVGGGAGGERETVSAAGTATGAAATLRRNGNRRAAHRERGAGSSSLNANDEGGGLVRSAQSSRAASPVSPRIPRVASISAMSRVQEGGSADGGASGTTGERPSQGQISHGAAMVAAQRILSLATESLDMMRGVTGVVKDSLDRADSWVSRLRAVGIQRAGQEGEAGVDIEGMSLDYPPEGFDGQTDQDLEYVSRHHRRNSSSQFSEGDDFTTSPGPFFSGASSATWASSASSIPGTPGGPNGHAYGRGLPSGSGVYGGYNATGTGTTTGASSPALGAGTMALPPIGRMTLQSRCNTPKSVAGDLPPEEEEGRGESERDTFEKSSDPSSGPVKVVGVDVDEEKMDVDS